MDVTKFAIEKKRITIIALLVILLTGITTYLSMPRAEDPGFIIRTAQIITYFPGASPERIELLVTDKIEKKLQEMPEIDNITSTSKTGISIIIVNVKKNYKKMRPIWDSLRRKVNDVAKDLPSGVIGPNVNDEFGDVFGTVFAITGEGYSYAELKEVADDVRSDLLLIEEVAKVEIHGVQEERIFVEYNNAKLSELGLSPGQLQRILDSRNIIFPGGQIYTEDEQIVLEPSGNFESLEELKKAVVKIPGSNQLVYLEDIVTIYRDYIDPSRSKVFYNGKPSLLVSISLREGGNIISLGEGVLERLERFQQVYPIGVDFEMLYFQPEFVDIKVQDFAVNLLQAILIVMFVMLVTLGFRTGLIVASLIPMAMVMAIMFMGFFGIGLDQMSLASLIIALGMLVDNSIVMSESIMVSISEGKDKVTAAIESAKELKIPLLTSSLTTAAAFLPIFLAESDVGEYTAPLFKVVTITLLCSWILSLTMIPLLCVLFLKVKQKETEESFDTSFYKKYRGFLVGILRYPLVTILVVIGMLFGAMNLAGLLPQIFFPANDKQVMEAVIEFPLGTPLIKTEAMVRDFDKFLAEEMRAEISTEGEIIKDGFTNWASFVGEGAPRFYLSYAPEPPSSNYSYVLINTTSRDKIDSEFIPKIENFLLENYPDVSYKVRPLALGPPVNDPVAIRVSGKDINKVYEITDKIKTKLSEISGAKGIKDDWGLYNKKLLVKINQPRALRAGLTSQDIAISLQTILSGITTTDFREGDEVIPVVLRSVGADRNDITKLESHSIYVQTTGRTVPLKQVADIEVDFQLAKILRRDKLRTVTVQSGITEGSNAIAIAKEVDSWLKEESKTWPIGYKYEFGGEIESSGEAGDSINAKLPIAGLLIILLLVAQFDSVRRPAIILLTIPLGMIGVILGLLAANQPFGFMALLGLISLAGIVINNAIVLIDRINIEINENGLEPARAIVEAAQRRLRPILLTTATTVGGLIPLWLGGGPLFESMAVAILFGLIFATALTLGFVPLLYSLFFRVKFKDFRY